MGANTETNPETVTVRANTDRSPVRVEDDGTSTEPDRPERLGPRLSRGIVTTEAEAQRLVVADGVDRDPIASFLSATDLESETLYLETARIEECFRLQLCAISWGTDEVHTEYGRLLRPYDESCVTDRKVFESRLIRIPAVLDGDEVTTYGSSVGEGPECSGDDGADTERVGGGPTTAAGRVDGGGR